MESPAPPQKSSKSVLRNILCFALMCSVCFGLVITYWRLQNGWSKPHIKLKVVRNHVIEAIRERYLQKMMHDEFNSVIPPIEQTTLGQEYNFNKITDTWRKDENADRLAKLLVEKDDFFSVKPSKIKFLSSHRAPCWQHGENVDCLLTFIIAGYHKCSSTDFWHRILQHPEMSGNIEKEVEWFSRRVDRSFSQYNKLYRRKDTRNNSITGEGSISTLSYTTGLVNSRARRKDRELAMALTRGDINPAHLVVQYVPQAKFIVFVREPGARLYSHYLHIALATKNQASPKDFHNRVIRVIEQFHKRCHKIEHRCARHPTMIYANAYSWIYLVEGMYVFSIKQALKLVPPQNMLFLRSEDYNKDRRRHLKTILEFLNMSSNDKILDRLSTAEIKLPNVKLRKNEKVPSWENRESGAEKMPMLPQTRRLLTDFYKPYNQQLAELLHDEKYLFSDVLTD